MSVLPSYCSSSSSSCGLVSGVVIQQQSSLSLYLTRSLQVRFIAAWRNAALAVVQYPTPPPRRIRTHTISQPDEWQSRLLTTNLLWPVPAHGFNWRKEGAEMVTAGSECVYLSSHWTGMRLGWAAQFQRAPSVSNADRPTLHIWPNEKVLQSRREGANSTREP